MITTSTEYERAQDELRDLTARMEELRRTTSAGEKGLTKAGVRKMIARLHEELAVYEGTAELRRPDAK